MEAGKSFADLATEEKLTILAQTAVTREGTAPGAAPLTGEAAAIAAKAFRHEPGDGAAVEDLGGGRLVVIETMAVTPAAPQPLGEIREVAIAGAAQDKAMAAARVKADAIVAAIRKGVAFDAALAAQGLPPAQPLAGRRLDIAQQQQVPPIVQAFLETPKGNVQVLPGGQGWVLIHISAIEPGKIDAVPGLLEAGRRDIAAQLPEEFAAAFAQASERALGTTRNTKTITAITRRLSGLDTGAQ